MQVKGTIYEDYQFYPNFKELKQFLALFGGIVSPSRDGWTLKVYQDVPNIVIKDNVYEKKTSLVTRSFDTKTQLLTHLKLGVEASTGKILNAEKGLAIPQRKIFTSPLGYQADHIPQLFGKYSNTSDEDRLLIAVFGDYDMERRTFHGQLDFTNGANIWNE